MKYFSHLALSALLLRLLVTGASIGDALALIGLSALLSYDLYLQSKKEPVANNDIRSRLTELEERLSVVSNKVNVSVLRK